MSAKYHTIIPITGAADPTTLNSPIGELDAAIDRVLDSGTSFPGSPTEGDRFWRTDSNKLYVYDGSSWAEILSGSASTGVVDIDDATAGEDLAERARVYLDLSDGEWYKVDSDAISTVKISPIRGFVAESGGILNGNTGAVRVQGVLGGFSGLTAGAVVYGSTTAGGCTQTKPAVTDGGGQIAIDRAGQAVSTTEILIQPYHVEFAIRETLANNATMTIEHFADAASMTRKTLATILTSVAGSSLTSYAETNKDSSIYLRGPSGAGATTTIDNAGTTSTVLGDTGGVEYWDATTCQLATAGILSQISVYFGANTGSPTGDVTWKICADGGTDPSTVLATGTFTPTPSSDNNITVTDGPFLATSTTYWLVLEVGAQSTGNSYNLRRNTGNPHAGGSFYYSTNGGSSWTNIAADDMRCAITTSATGVVKDKSSQSFQVTGAQTVGSVKLWMRKWGSPTGTMTLRIETDNSGDPSGSLVDANATITVAESGLTTTYGWITFSFATSFSVSGSTTYHIVLSTDRSASDSNYVAWGADASSPGYADGDMRYYESSTWSTESKDACFDVLGADTEYQEPCVMGRWSGGTRDCAVRYDDGSAADEAIKTTFKNVTGSEVDMTCIVRVQ